MSDQRSDPGDPGDRAIAGARDGEKDPRDGGMVPGVGSPEKDGASSLRSGQRRAPVHLWIEYDAETGVVLRGRL